MRGSARSIVLGDLHLVRHTPRAVTRDLASLIAEHPGDRLVFVGDLLDLSSDMPKVPRREAVAAALGAHPEARSALANHLDRGGEIWLVGGNHDADIGRSSFDAALAGELGVTGEALSRLRTSPWFFRDRGLHIEHGHIFDPDNAPAHPLAIGNSMLGVHFVEEFIAPAKAHLYLTANHGTPLELFLHSFKWYGPRAPYVIYRYFHAATTALLKSGSRYDVTREVALGRERLEGFAAGVGLPSDVVEALIASGATPTMASLSRVFTRLYLDRVLATIAMGVGLPAAILATNKGWAAALLGFGAILMGASWAMGHNRYASTTVQERLERGAEKVRSLTGARLVVFGHTHREAFTDGYANTGSFSFPQNAPGRPYLIVDNAGAEPRIERRYLKTA